MINKRNESVLNKVFSVHFPPPQLLMNLSVMAPAPAEVPVGVMMTGTPVTCDFCSKLFSA